MALAADAANPSSWAELRKQDCGFRRIMAQTTKLVLAAKNRQKVHPDKLGKVKSVLCTDFCF